MPGHVYWRDRNGICLGCNDAQYKTLGLISQNDYIGKTVFDFYPKDIAEMITRNDNQVIESGKPLVTEERGRNKRGDLRIFLSHKVPLFNEKGEVTGIIGVSTDVTDARKEELERKDFLENIIGLMPGHVYWKDLEGRYLGCNDEQAKSLGLSSRYDIVNRVQYQDLPKEEAEKYIKLDQEIIDNGKSITREEFRLLEDGAIGSYLSKKTPLRDKENKVTGLLGVSFDISDRKHAENELMVAKEKAEQINQMKSEFLLDMEHDIRTPLAGIQGLAEALAYGEGDAEKQKLLKLMERSARELMVYCNEILDFSKTTKGDLPINNELFKIKELVDSIAAFELLPARYKKIKFEVDVDDKVPALLFGDRYRIKRLLINVVSNAIKFTDEGGVKFLVSLFSHDKMQRRAIINFTIKDTGIGIPDDKLNLVFDKFVRLERSNKGLKKGQGLGLAVVKQFVDELGGEIKLRSTVGKGSTFQILVPITIPADSVISAEGRF